MSFHCSQWIFCERTWAWSNPMVLSLAGGGKKPYNPLPSSPHRLSLHWDLKKSYLPLYWGSLVISVRQKWVNLLCSHQCILHTKWKDWLNASKVFNFSSLHFHHSDRTETLDRWCLVHVVDMTGSFLPLDLSNSSKKGALGQTWMLYYQRAGTIPLTSEELQ